jgi:hypothetical protein
MTAIQNPIAGSSADQPVARIGQIIRSVGGRVNLQSRLDAAGVRAQVTVISVPATVDNAATYQIRIVSTTPGLELDVTVEHLTAATTGSLCRNGLIAAIEAESSLGLLIASAAPGTNIITLTGADPGRTFTVSYPSNATTTVDLSTTSSTAPGYSTYLYGQAVEVVEVSGQPTGMRAQGVQDPELPTRATFIANIATNTNSQTSTVRVTHTYADGRPATIDTLEVSSGASAALTTAAIVAAAEALWTDASVAITVVDDVVTVTFPPGESVGVISVVNTSTLDIAYSTTAAADLPQLALVVDSYDVAPNPPTYLGGGTDVTGPRGGTPPLTADASGSTEWCVTTPGSTLAGTRVYVDTDGVLYDAPAVDRIPWPQARWTRVYDATRAGLEF